MSPAAAVTVAETVEVEEATFTLVLTAASPLMTQGYSPSVTKVMVPPGTFSASSRVAASAGCTLLAEPGLATEVAVSADSAMTGMVTSESTIAIAISVARIFFML